MLKITMTKPVVELSTFFGRNFSPFSPKKTPTSALPQGITVLSAVQTLALFSWGVGEFVKLG